MGGDRCTVKLEVDYTRGGHHSARNHCKVMRSPVLEPRKEKTVWSRLNHFTPTHPLSPQALPPQPSQSSLLSALSGLGPNLFYWTINSLRTPCVILAYTGSHGRYSAHLAACLSNLLGGDGPHATKLIKKAVGSGLSTARTRGQTHAHTISALIFGGSQVFRSPSTGPRLSTSK